MRRLVLAAALALALPAAAQERIVDKTDLLDAEITLSQAAERHAALFEFLRNDARGALADARDLAADEAKDAGADFRQHTLRVSDDDRFVGGGYVSLVRTYAAYTGGAHGNQHLDPLTWDVARNEFVRLDHFLTPELQGLKALEAISAELRKALKAKHGEDYETWKNDVVAATVPDVTVLQNFTLEPSNNPGKVGGIAFHYSPYEVGPYAMGPVRVMIPQAVFAAGLKAEVKGLFVGSPR